MTPLLPAAMSLTWALFWDWRAMPAEEPPPPRLPPPPPPELQPRPFPEQAADITWKVAWWMAYDRARRPIAQMVEKHLNSKAAESLPKWRAFWKIAIKRLGLRGTIAAGLVAMDGPMPVGDAIALGLTVWMLYDLYVMADEVWDIVEELHRTGQLENF